ncbi:hypothetical protein GCM10009775_14780 [Microbacterium aoyamense]|uniref:MinD-like ATPase involved in chromosome partitioning or flagellar assembly n=1 Tax=Microbacterium aoyamense TaxID=344166 RepID=A0ABP5AWG7_9MICO|nr:hypothetical protein [Microbacterium aoyamense]
MTTIDVRGLPGAVFGSGVARRRELTGWDAAIRRRSATTRRIGFVSLDAGLDTATLAARTTRVLAARRREPVLAVDVTAGGEFAARLGITAAPRAARPAPRVTAEAVEGLTHGAGWYGLRGRSDDGPVEAWISDAAPVSRFFDVCVTDFGARHPLDDFAACAALCDAVCIVADARRERAELARALGPAIMALPESPLPVFAILDRRGGGATARAMDADPWPVVGIPRSPAPRAHREPTAHATRMALLRLCAALVAGPEAAA